MASMVEDTQVTKHSTKCDSMLAFSRQIGNFMYAVDLLRGIHFRLCNFLQVKIIAQTQNAKGKLPSFDK
jgi:hypothetical protein